jgi:hypothetical protein
MIFLVDSDTLYVEFMAGYAGVMMGIKWTRSMGFTLGFHTRRASGPLSSVWHSVTGSGHFHTEYTRKNLLSSVDGAAFGYS